MVNDRYKLILGDCLEKMKEIPDKSIDLCLTDPPYSTPTVTSFGRKKVVNLADLSIQEFYFREVRKQLERILKPNGRVFIFCDDKYYPILFGVFYEWDKKQLLIWDKKRIGMGTPFRKRHELIFYVNRETYEYKRTDGITHYPTVLQYSHDLDKVHGAQKPVQLLEDLIKGFTNENDLVLDPFNGGGSTGVACAKTNRRYIGIELNADYFEIARKRINEALNNEPLFA
jgi:site-specific DNA-methyltransferase (adenine-specific)